MATETDLEAADWRIADGTRRIADLKAYIEKQEQAGRPTDEARELLALFGANVISSLFIGVELTSWKARTQPQVTAVFDPKPTTSRRTYFSCHQQRARRLTANLPTADVLATRR
jgi:hypothetical protein